MRDPVDWRNYILEIFEPYDRDVLGRDSIWTWSNKKVIYPVQPIFGVKQGGQGKVQAVEVGNGNPPTTNAPVEPKQKKAKTSGQVVWSLKFCLVDAFKGGGVQVYPR